MPLKNTMLALGLARRTLKANTSRSTHDPILALMGDRRIVIRNGAVASVIETTAEEKANLKALEHIDRSLMALRQLLRGGQRIDAPLNWAFNAGKD